MGITLYCLNLLLIWCPSKEKHLLAGKLTISDEGKTMVLRVVVVCVVTGVSEVSIEYLSQSCSESLIDLPVMNG